MFGRLAPVIFLLTLAAPGARAEYVLGALDDILRDDVSIVDATVETITAEGFADLRIHECFKGDPPTRIQHLALSCRGPYPVSAVLGEGKRYLLVLSGDDLYEGSLAWEILRSFDGELWCRYRSDAPVDGGRMPAYGLIQRARLVARIRAVLLVGQESVAFETIARGTNGAAIGPAHRVIAEPVDWRETWVLLHGNQAPTPPCPEVEFADEVLLLVEMGSKSTGGYSIEVVAIRPEGGGLVVEVRETSPEPEAMVTQSFTSPYHVVRMTRIDTEITFRVIE